MKTCVLPDDLHEAITKLAKMEDRDIQVVHARLIRTHPEMAIFCPEGNPAVTVTATPPTDQPATK